jgi:hypothetical protein
MQTKDILKIVLASPSDVQDEREIMDNIIDEINRGIAETVDLRLELIKWETDAYPGFHAEGPQGLIDPILRIQECDILIGIFWSRFGTPTKDALSGTEHEFNTALKSWKEYGRPQIMVYFRQDKFSPKTAEEKEQFDRVMQFKQIFPKEGLFWNYKKKNFANSVRNHLTLYIKQHASFLKSTNAKLLATRPNLIVSKIELIPTNLSGNPPLTFKQVEYFLYVHLKNVGSISIKQLGIEIVLPSFIKCFPWTDKTPMHHTISQDKFTKHIFHFEQPIFVTQNRPISIMRLRIDDATLFGTRRSDPNCILANDNIGWIVFADNAPPKFGQDRLTALSKLSEQLNGFAEHRWLSLEVQMNAKDGLKTTLDITKFLS